MTPTLWIVSWYAAMSVVAFALYGIDKRRAVKGRWRLPEKQLHFVDLLGGWPGGFAGRSFFRHKRRKLSFMIVSWAIVLAHVGVWGWLGWRTFGPEAAGGGP